MPVWKVSKKTDGEKIILRLWIFERFSMTSGWNCLIGAWSQNARCSLQYYLKKNPIPYLVLKPPLLWGKTACICKCIIFGPLLMWSQACYWLFYDHLEQRNCGYPCITSVWGLEPTRIAFLLLHLATQIRRNRIKWVKHFWHLTNLTVELKILVYIEYMISHKMWLNH